MIIVLVRYSIFEMADVRCIALDLYYMNIIVYAHPVPNSMYLNIMILMVSMYTYEVIA